MARNNSKSSKEKSDKKKAQRKERFEKRSKDADGLEEAVVAGMHPRVNQVLSRKPDAQNAILTR